MSSLTTVVEPLLFILGCAITIGAGISLTLWMVTHPASVLPKEELFWSEWAVFRKYFLLPFACMVIGVLSIVFAIVLACVA